MAEKIYALDLNGEEWTEWLLKELNQPKFRADQMCQWVWQKRVFNAEQMTNLSMQLREELSQRVDFSPPSMLKEQRSKIDGTRKYLWQLRDGNSVESVLLRQDDRLTACVSTQVGCPLQCAFCATGISGYVRNLTAGEIAGQFLAMEAVIGRDINNIVYMGMGEPFLNTENVLKSVRMLNSPKMRNLGIRHMTISTSGVVPGILELAQSGLGVRLAISLHAANDELRDMLMPVNRTFPLDELRGAMQEYQRKTNDRITIEYVLLGGVNDSAEHARELVRFLKGIHVFINLIPFNDVDARYQRPEPATVLRFRTILETAGFESEIRQEQGSDIDAACGQLRRRSSSDRGAQPEDTAPKAGKTDAVRSDAQENEPRTKTGRPAGRENVPQGRTARDISPRGVKAAQRGERASKKMLSDSRAKGEGPGGKQEGQGRRFQKRGDGSSRTEGDRDKGSLRGDTKKATTRQRPDSSAAVRTGQQRGKEAALPKGERPRKKAVRSRHK